MDKQQRLADARAALEADDLEAAQALLTPLLAVRDPEALYQCASFSLGRDETTEQFEARALAYLRESAEAGFAPAIYQLAIRYEIGDQVAPDAQRAAQLFQQAAQAGSMPAKYWHGMNLYYGAHGMARDEQAGLALIGEAAAAHVESAIDFLDELANPSA